MLDNDRNTVKNRLIPTLRKKQMLIQSKQFETKKKYHEENREKLKNGKVRFRRNNIP